MGWQKQNEGCIICLAIKQAVEAKKTEWDFHSVILSKETIFWMNSARPALHLGCAQLLLEALLCPTSALPPALLLRHRPRAGAGTR